MQDKKLPNTSPMLICNNAPCEMRKAHDSSWLCKRYKNFHILQRGVIGACAEINKIIHKLRLLVPVSKATSSQVDVLTDIKYVVATQSKLGRDLPGNYPTLPGNSPNYRDLGWRGEVDKTILVYVTGAELFSQCGNYHFVPRRLLYVDRWRVCIRTSFHVDGSTHQDICIPTRQDIVRTMPRTIYQ